VFFVLVLNLYNVLPDILHCILAHYLTFTCLYLHLSPLPNQTKACPALKVAFTINGVFSLFKTVRKLSPVVPVYKLRLSLRSGPNSPDVGSFSIAALLGHVTMSYRWVWNVLFS
jgi:hypothetical protein